MLLNLTTVLVIKKLKTRLKLCGIIQKLSKLVSSSSKRVSSRIAMPFDKSYHKHLNILKSILASIKMLIRWPLGYFKLFFLCTLRDSYRPFVYCMKVEAKGVFEWGGCGLFDNILRSGRSYQAFEWAKLGCLCWEVSGYLLWPFNAAVVAAHKRLNHNSAAKRLKLFIGTFEYNTLSAISLPAPFKTPLP
jgi:hypothetical protein